MVSSHTTVGHGPRRFAAARLALAAVLCSCAANIQAQQNPAGQPVAIDNTIAAKLVWETMIALNQANITGNYSVLRDLGAPGFQVNNSAATLAGTFQVLRAQQVDLGNCLIIAPVFEFPPAIVQSGMLRLRGSFPLRPIGVAFDMLFMNVGGQWRLFGLAVVPIPPQPANVPAIRAQSGSTRR